MKKNDIKNISDVKEEIRDKNFYDYEEKGHDFIYLEWFSFKVENQRFAYYIVYTDKNLPEHATNETPSILANNTRNLFANKKMSLQVLPTDNVLLLQQNGYADQLQVEDACHFYQGQ